MAYFSTEVWNEVVRLLNLYTIELKFVPVNTRSYGKYICYGDNRHVIEIAENLAGIDFIDTFVHEVAHAVTWITYQKSVQPHGKEWKLAYHRLMVPFFFLRVCTSNELELLSNPGTRKHQSLQDMKTNYPGMTFVCELEIGRRFLYDGIPFIVVNKGRGINYMCRRTDNNAPDNKKFPFPKFTVIELES
jgi:hypothetical protein